MLHLSECNGKLKMAFARVACLETEHYLASYSHADFRPIGRSCVEFFELLASFGVTQHFAIVDGDYTAELETLAQFYNIEFLHL